MTTPAVKTEGEYFEHESFLLFKDIKKELKEEILFTEKEEVKIDLEHESSLLFKDIKKELQEEILLKEEDLKKIDFDAEVQKLLSGIDLIDCFIQNSLLGLHNSEYKVKTDQFFSSLKKIGDNFKKLWTSFERINGIVKIIELERIIFPPKKKVNYYTIAKSNSDFDGRDKELFSKVTRFYQNFLNYKSESKLKVIQNNWLKGSTGLPGNPEEFEIWWGKLMAKIKTKLQINIKSYDCVMKNIIEIMKKAKLEKCVCQFEDPDMVWHRYYLCDDGVKFIKEYCGYYQHIGLVVLSEPHWKKCTKCFDTFEKNCKKRDKNLAKNKRKMDRNIELKKKKISTTLNNDKETVCITVSAENPEKITSESGEINVESIEYDQQLKMLDKKITEDIEYKKTDSLKRKTSDDYIQQSDDVLIKKARQMP